MKKNEYIKKLSKKLFWEMKIDTLNWKHNKQDIIERIDFRGTEEDKEIMHLLYSEKKF